MRRIATACFTLAAAATVALTGTASAYAASGTLYLNRAEFSDPSGCYNAPQHDPFVYNNTDERVLVFAERDCRGPVTATVAPQDHQDVKGLSVFVR